MNLRIAFLALAAAILQPVVAQTESKIIANEFTDLETCRILLEEFQWFCDVYESPMWEDIYGETYWKLTEFKPTPAYRYDLDGDGTEDLIVKIGWGCGTTGCQHQFLFGDQTPIDELYGYSIIAAGSPVLTACEGSVGLIFEGNMTWCHPINEIRESTLGARIYRLGK